MVGRVRRYRKPLGTQWTVTAVDPDQATTGTVTLYLYDLTTGDEIAVGTTAGESSGQNLVVTANGATAGLVAKEYGARFRDGNGVVIFPNDRYRAILFDLYDAGVS